MPFGPKTLKIIPLSDLQNIRPVKDRPGYFVSRVGKVFCIRELSQRVDPERYHRIVMKVRGCNKHGAVHALVAQAFKIRKPGDHLVRHLDGNPENNHADNLEWGTAKENSADMVIHGTVANGEKNTNAIHTAEKVIAIRKDHKSGMKPKQLLQKYDIKEDSLKSILYYQSWRHLR